MRSDAASAPRFRVVALVAVALVAALSWPRAAAAWMRVLRGGSTSYASSVAIDPEGNAVASGLVEREDGRGDFTVVKLSGKRGRILWRFVINGHELPAFRSGPRTKAELVAIDTAANVLAAGTVVEGNETRGVVVKLAGATGTEYLAARDRRRCLPLQSGRGRRR